MVTSGQRFTWDETPWEWGKGYGRAGRREFHVVAIDYGIKRNILRLLAGNGCKVTVVPAKTSADDIVALKPDGVFLSNGPGDPAATGEYAVPVIRDIIDRGIPTFGICLGHQMLGIAVGAKTMKMHQGHHGANHPVKDLATGKVEITSMNHGFAVDRATLPANAIETHVSLFDGSNCGIALKDKPVFSVQYHPEASPGPRDSHYLFERFTELMRNCTSANSLASLRAGTRRTIRRQLCRSTSATTCAGPTRCGTRVPVTGSNELRMRRFARSSCTREQSRRAQDSRTPWARDRALGVALVVGRRHPVLDRGLERRPLRGYAAYQAATPGRVVPQCARA